MADIVKQNMDIIRNAYNRATQLVTKIYDLSYFDKTNYEKNIHDFEPVLVTEKDSKLFGQNELALYYPIINKLCIQESLLHEGVLNEDITCLVMLHEMLHMASTNREKQETGFNHEAYPITYNEGLTQYLALKIYYDNIEEAIKNNIIYPESTTYVKKIIDELGEEKVFNGFFKAKARESVEKFSPKELDKFTETIMALTNSLEEKQSKENLNNFEQMKEAPSL